MNSDPELEIDCQSVQKKLIAGEDFLMLDCREADEYAVAKIAQGKLIPMSEIADRLGELEPHRHRSIVVYCHMGGRSLRVARWLREQGFPQAQSMAGGIEQWSEEIDPTVPQY
jgi:rhodanese-related sulfurtransferase